ncbi:MAG: hypothetical protein Q4D19_09490 [Lautropia sp.]|nr:hypothetical protein [Lautropia sp.]
MATAIAPFSTNHLADQQHDSRIGGPDKLESLFSREQIRQDFDSLDVLLLEEQEITLHEGLLHNGTGAVIRFVGRRPG